MKRFGPRGVLVILLLVMAGLSAPAQADERTEARRHFEAGMELIAQSNFAEGVAELEEAYAILPHPAVLYNIGRAWRDAGELEKSLAAFRRYLDSDPEDRQEVESAIANLEQRIAAEKKASAPADPTEPRPSAPAPMDTTAPHADDADKASGLYDEMVVTASKRSQSPLDAPSSTTIVTRQDIRLSGITRIPELLRRVAGMDVQQITEALSTDGDRCGSRPRLASQSVVVQIGAPVDSAYCEANPTPSTCTPR